MIRRILLSLVLLAGALLAGCASGPKFAEIANKIPPVPADQGRIYFFRSSSMMGAALQPDIRLNGQVVGSSKPGGFFYVDRPAGQYVAATSADDEKAASFTLATGETKYLRTSPTFGVLVGHVVVQLEDPAKAQAEVQTLSLTPSVATAAPAAMPVAAAPAASPGQTPTAAPASGNGRPAGTRHLDAAMLDRHTWTYPHPRDPQRYGNVQVKFRNGIATAYNTRSSSSGPYTVVEDMVCANFESPVWGRLCWYVYDSAATPGGPLMPRLFITGTQASVPLTIK